MKYQLNLPTELTSDRLVLRPVDLKYAQAVFKVFTDDVTEHMFPSTPETVEDTKEFIRGSIRKLETKSDYTVFIFDKATGELLGGGGLHHMDTKTPGAGIWIKMAAHGHKYGREAVAILKHWADQNLDYDYLLYPVAAVNAASRSIPESLGGVLERSYQYKNQAGQIRDFVEYRIYKEKKAK